MGTCKDNVKQPVSSKEGSENNRQTIKSQTPTNKRTFQTGRRADIEPLEWSRIFHVLGDHRMLVARQKMYLCETRHELDSQPSDPWD